MGFISNKFFNTIVFFNCITGLFLSHSAQALTPNLEQRKAYFEKRQTSFYPASLWTYQHIEQFHPGVTLPKSDESQIQLPLDLAALDDVPISDLEGNLFPLRDLRDHTRLDAILVLKNGKIRYEHYYNDQKIGTRHQTNSITKSLAGLAIQPFIDAGKIERDRLVSDYIPELAHSGWAGATVNEVLNMDVSLNFREVYDDPNADFAQYSRSMSLAQNQSTQAIGLKAYLQTILKGKKSHGSGFDYITPNADVACWLIEKVSGKSASQVIFENVWSKIGAAQDAFIRLDLKGDTFCGGGLSITARDLARIGLVLLDTVKGNTASGFSPQLRHLFIQPTTNDSVQTTHILSTEKGWDYEQLWWFRHDAHHSFRAIGVNGQWLYIDPVENVIVVLLSADGVPGDFLNNTMSLNIIDAIIPVLN